MIADEAAHIIEALAGSLREHPGQFNLNVSVAGIRASAGAPGAQGMVVSVTGGGSYSSTTGVVGQTSAGDLEFATGRANERLLEVSSELAELARETRELGRIPKEKTRSLLRDLAPAFPLIAAVLQTVSSLVGSR